jgi:hypothetical protein
MKINMDVANANGGFLFTTFKGENSPMSEQVYFGLSSDGRSWEALNNGEPVLVSRQGTRGVRDPFILRSHDNTKFFLIATDFSNHLQPDWSKAVREGSKSIVIWESPDLIHWSEPRLVAVAAEDAGCAWAPEAIYDENTGEYLVFWASTNARDDFAKHRIWASRTSDFKTFGEPFVYIDKPHDVIDTDIVRDGDKYFRFSKDEKFKAITLEVTDELTGPWQEVSDFSLGKLEGYEGPQCFLIEPATPAKPSTWCLLLDHYSQGRGYQLYLCNDLGAGQFVSTHDVSFPFPFRHGSVLPVTAEEYSRLKESYGH